MLEIIFMAKGVIVAEGEEKERGEERTYEAFGENARNQSRNRQESSGRELHFEIEQRKQKRIKVARMRFIKNQKRRGCCWKM